MGRYPNMILRKFIAVKAIRAMRQEAGNVQKMKSSTMKAWHPEACAGAMWCRRDRIGQAHREEAFELSTDPDFVATGSYGLSRSSSRDG
jgi:hypothetical protein